jgi:hypothetical protein
MSRPSGAGYLQLDTFPHHVSRLLVLAPTYESRMPKVIVGCPFHVFELVNQLWIQPTTVGQLRRYKAGSPRSLLASGRFTNGHSLVFQQPELLHQLAA